MTELVELALPCRVVTLTMRMGKYGQMTTLEDLVARAWLTDRTTLQDLSNFLGLPLAIVKDVAIDMWHKGFMTFDLDTGTVDLTDTTREILSRDGTVAESSEDIVTMDFLFEPTTGRMLRKGTASARERSLRLPRTDVTESDLDQAELVHAVQAALREDERRGVRRTVLEVSFGNPLLRTAEATRWVSILVSVQRYPQSDSVTVTPMDSSWRVRDTQRLNAYLGRLADEEPDHPVLQSLRGHADLMLRPPDRMDELIDRLGEMVAELATVRPEQIDRRNTELRRLANQIRDRLVINQSAHARVTLVSRAEGHTWALEDLINSARSQLIIVSPSLAYQRVRELLPALADAVDRGIQLVIIWGRTLDDDVPSQIGTAFATLRDQHPERVLIARRSARTEACLVVQDDRRALVGCHPPLSRSAVGDAALSVLVEPADDDAPRAVADLLLWARRQFPHWQEGQRIRLHPKQFGRPTEVARGPTAVDVPLPAVDAEWVDEPVIRLWAQSWAEHYAALVDACAQADARGPIVEVVSDGEHQTLLDHCLRGARRRLIITDDRIDPAIADAHFAQAIRERRSDGAAVLLVHPQPPHHGDAEDKFAALARGPDKVAARRAAGGARLALSDDQLLIGSYSPLAGGHGRHGRLGRRRSHVGLHIQSEAIAAEVAGLLRAEPASAGRPAADRSGYTPDTRLPSAAPAALPLLFAARAASPGRPFAEQVVQGLRDVSDPWTVIDVWQENQVSVAELRTAVAALLRAGQQTGSASGRKWTKWLVHEAWQRRAFVEAAVLGGLLPDDAVDLRTVALLGTALEFGPVDIVADAALELADSTDAAALGAGAVGALAEMLLWADEDGTQALGLLSEFLPESWRELAERAIRFADTGVALPLDSLVAEHRQTSDRLAMRARTTRLAAEIDKLRQLRQRFDFETGRALYAALFASDGLLTVIDRACADPVDPGGELRGRLPANVQAYLNEQIADAGVPPMEWYRQGAYLRSIEDIVRSARIVATTRMDGAPLLVDQRLTAACEAFGSYLTGTWDRLFVAAKSVDEPYDQPFLAMLERLNPLLEWARERT